MIWTVNWTVPCDLILMCCSDLTLIVNTKYAESANGQSAICGNVENFSDFESNDGGTGTKGEEQIKVPWGGGGTSLKTSQNILYDIRGENDCSRWGQNSITVKR